MNRRERKRLARRALKSGSTRSIAGSEMAIKLLEKRTRRANERGTMPPREPMKIKLPDSVVTAKPTKGNTKGRRSPQKIMVEKMRKAREGSMLARVFDRLQAMTKGD